MSLRSREKKTKIIVTVGPSIRTRPKLREILEGGADIVRYNFSHGSAGDFRELMITLRALEEELDRPVGVLADLQGPKIRTGLLRDHTPVQLENGREIRLTRRELEGDATVVSISYPFDPAEFQPGMKILMDDGKIVLSLQAATPDSLLCRIEKGGLLRERKGVNFPNLATRLPSLTDKDRADAAAALEAGADFIALSFVRCSADMEELRRLVDAAGRRAFLVAKIEKPQALEHLDEILAVSDGIMVARGDLGVEVEIERIGVLQKEIVHRCRRARVPVIIATQMLESMTTQPAPTRAEATDVTNAILDGADAMMLSGETATGEYPVEAVRVMTAIARETEGYMVRHCRYAREVKREPRIPDKREAGAPDSLFSIAHAAVTAAEDLAAQGIIVHTLSGRTAILLSRFQPASPVMALTPDPVTWRQLTLLFGVQPFRITHYQTSDDLMIKGEEWIRGKFHVERPSHFIILSGLAYTIGATNSLRVINLQPEALPPGGSGPTEATR